MNISERVKERRKALDLTLQQVGDFIGVTKATVLRYESGDIQNIGLDKIEKLAKVLNVSPGWLMGWEKDSSVKSPPTLDIIPVGELIKIPIIGTVRAGQGGIAYEEHLGYNLTAKSGLSTTKPYFFLRVKGESMAPQIVPGDIVLVSPDEDVDDNDIAVVIVNGEEGMVKRIQKTEKGLILYSVNPDHPPRVIMESEEHYIVGKVIKVERWY